MDKANDDPKRRLRITVYYTNDADGGHADFEEILAERQALDDHGTWRTTQTATSADRDEAKLCLLEAYDIFAIRPNQVPAVPSTKNQGGIRGTHNGR